MKQPEITGYRELSENDAEWMNEAKELAIEVGEFVARMKAEGEILDQRWVDIGTADLQKGFMALCRAVARPETF